MTLTFFTRSGCSLCEAALEELHAFLEATGPDAGEPISVNIVDLAEHPELETTYGSRVPVIEWQGKEICHFFFDESAVRKCLRHHKIAV
jgi:hypothetical protein